MGSMSPKRPDVLAPYLAKFPERFNRKQPQPSPGPDEWPDALPHLPSRILFGASLDDFIGFATVQLLEMCEISFVSADALGR